MKDYAFSTRAIHAGQSPLDRSGASTPPIYQTAAFSQDTGEALADVFTGRRFGHIYTRISNPTVSAFEAKVTTLENGLGSVATASGMAAILVLVQALAAAGDELVVAKSLFGGTYHLFEDVVSKFGIKVHYVDTTNPAAYEAAINPKTRFIFVESIGNPKIDVPPIAQLAEIAKRSGIPLVVDSTVTSPYLLPAKQLGVSIAVHSATKYMGIGGSAIGGVLVDLGNFTWKACKSPDIREAAGRFGDFAFLAIARRNGLSSGGACLSPMNAYLLSLGIETMGLRLNQHCRSALSLATYLHSHPKVKAVRYPGLPSHPAHELARAQFGGKFGALMTIELGSQAECFSLIPKLKLAKNQANIGDSRTLIIHPASTIYHDVPTDVQASAGVTPNLLRISVGLEDEVDILNDFQAALDQI